MKRLIQILLLACLAFGASGFAEARGVFVGPGYYPYYRRPYYSPYYSYYPYYRRPIYYTPVVAPYYPAYYSPYYYPAYYGPGFYYGRPGFSISVGSGY